MHCVRQLLIHFLYIDGVGMQVGVLDPMAVTSINVNHFNRVNLLLLNNNNLLNMFFIIKQSYINGI